MKLLQKLYEIHSPSGGETKMINFVAKECAKRGANVRVDEHGNIYAIKGVANDYPCVVAHTDQVQGKYAPDYRVLFVDDIVMAFEPSNMSQQGLGADDKNGIWIALKCLEDFDAIKCAFFVSEEIGTVGSSKADMNFFNDCRFVLECDRKGNSDLITEIGWTKICGDDFLAEIPAKEFGYDTTAGMLTDVITLTERGLRVSSVNISCGYYHPHSSHEVTRISDLENCLNFVRAIITRCTKVYHHTGEPVQREAFSYGKYGKLNRLNFGDDWRDDYYGYYGGVIEDDFDPKTDLQELNDYIYEQIYDYFYHIPQATFSEMWNAFIADCGIKKRKAKKIFKQAKDDFVTFNGDFSTECEMI